MTALGIDVAGDLLDRWRGWFAPALQPFGTGRLGGGATEVGRSYEPSLNLRDTFHVYTDEDWAWLEEPEFTHLDLRTKRALVHGRAGTGRVRELPPAARAIVDLHRVDSRVVWWPSLLRRVGDQPLVRYVENGLPRSRHRELSPARWTEVSALLPGAADLAGRFPAASGPNCFGNVMAAAGEGDGLSQIGREAFEAWLGRRTERVRGTGRDHLAGVVLVWRDHDGRAEHAAVTIGNGYTFNKPSQGWFSPHLVWTVPETIAASRYRGAVLSRHLITP